jgi:hypothetical protein
LGQLCKRAPIILYRKAPGSTRRSYTAGAAIEKLSATLTVIAEILNFALNLEYLEAEFCSVATYGGTLQERGIIPDSAAP